MSGFLAIIGTKADTDQLTAVNRQSGFTDRRTCRSVYSTDWCVLAARLRADEHLSIAKDDERGIVLALLGFAVVTDGQIPVQVQATDLIRRLNKDGEPVLEQLEGSWQIVVVDEQNRRFSVYADHLASRPLFYAQTGDRLVVSTSGREVLSLGSLKQHLSIEGVAGFLTVGYPLGPNTLLAGISRLQPGRVLTFNLTNRQLSQRVWWDLRFSEMRNISFRDAVDQLHEQVLAAHRLVLLDKPDPFYLALTGGHDSRLILGALREIDHLPHAAFTWAASSTVEGSDLDIAARLAEVAGITHKPLLYAAEDFVENLNNWTLQTELMSDNLGHFAAGADFLPRHGITDGKILLGDQVFGLGKMYNNRDEAIAAVLRIPWPHLGKATSAALTEKGRINFQEILHQQIDDILSGCDSNHPKDLHHYLYYHVGVFGWLLAPGYYKEPIFEARRPLMTRRLLDTVVTWPHHLRVDKKVLVELLNRYYPDLYAIPTAHASALVDWTAALRDHVILTEILRDLLSGKQLSSTELADFVDNENVRYSFEAVASSQSVASDLSTNKLEWAFNLRRKFGGTRAGAPLLHAAEAVARRFVKTKEKGSSQVRIIFRLALLENHLILINQSLN